MNAPKQNSIHHFIYAVISSKTLVVTHYWAACQTELKVLCKCSKTNWTFTNCRNQSIANNHKHTSRWKPMYIDNISEKHMTVTCIIFRPSLLR